MTADRTGGEALTHESEFVFRDLHARQNGWSARWLLIGQHGAVELWYFTQGDELAPRRDGYDGTYMGGIETHYRQPPDYMRDDPPTFEDCDVLRGLCWHDGSSLAASEHYLPRALDEREDVRSMLLDCYRSQFGVSVDV